MHNGRFAVRLGAHDGSGVGPVQCGLAGALDVGSGGILGGGWQGGAQIFFTRSGRVAFDGGGFVDQRIIEYIFCLVVGCCKVQ